MKLSRNGIKLILDFEGKHKKLPGGRYQAYRCPAGVWTIYAGITDGVREGLLHPVGRVGTCNSGRRDHRHACRTDIVAWERLLARALDIF